MSTVYQYRRRAKTWFYVSQSAVPVLLLLITKILVINQSRDGVSMGIAIAAAAAIWFLNLISFHFLLRSL